MVFPCLAWFCFIVRVPFWKRLRPVALMSLTEFSECPRGTRQALMPRRSNPPNIVLPCHPSPRISAALACPSQGESVSGSPCHYLQAVVTGLGLCPALVSFAPHAQTNGRDALPNPPFAPLRASGLPAWQRGTCNPRTPALAALKAAAGYRLPLQFSGRVRSAPSDGRSAPLTGRSNRNRSPVFWYPVNTETRGSPHGGVGSGSGRNDTLSVCLRRPEIFAGEQDVRPAQRRDVG